MKALEAMLETKVDINRIAKLEGKFAAQNRRLNGQANKVWYGGPVIVQKGPKKQRRGRNKKKNSQPQVWPLTQFYFVR